MLRRAGDLIGLTIAASDGEVGELVDLLFDDERWTVRWAAVNAGSWLSGRSVLLAPEALQTVSLADRRLSVALTRAQVESSPPVTADQPVSRQLQARLYGYYGWAPYWDVYGDLAVPPTIMAPSAMASDPTVLGAAAGAEQGDPHLRSADEVTGYYIKARDGDLGHVDDLIIDDADWSVRYLLVDTGNWWPGRKVLISKGWVADVSWAEQQVTLDLTRNEIKGSPAYDPDRLDRAYEEVLHAHYGRPGYWGDTISG